MKYAALLLFFSLLTCLAGCTVPSTEARIGHADNLAGEAGWEKEILATDTFDLVVYRPAEPKESSGQLTLYIEGDGLAWINRSRISSDPTPVQPMGLQLALSQPGITAVYIARPCQYGQKRNCTNRYWTSARFAPEVIDAINQSVELLKQRYQAERIELVGYSGGAAIATLLAAQRDDVSRLLTVAGNLDHVTWSKYHKVSPLKGSLNPADEWQALEDIPQHHFVGEKDQVMPLEVAEAYAGKFPDDRKPDIQVISGMDHSGHWWTVWPGLYTGQTNLTNSLQ